MVVETVRVLAHMEVIGHESQVVRSSQFFANRSSLNRLTDCNRFCLSQSTKTSSVGNNAAGILRWLARRTHSLPPDKG